jgi:hypothetical protein
VEQIHPVDPPTTYDAKKDIEALLKGTFSDNKGEVYQIYDKRYKELLNTLSEDVQRATEEQFVEYVAATFSGVYEIPGIAFDALLAFEDGLNGNDFKDISLSAAFSILEGAGNLPVISVINYGAKTIHRLSKIIADFERLECYGIVLRYLKEFDIKIPIPNVLSLSDGETVSGTEYTIYLDATDDVGVTRIIVKIGGDIFLEELISPASSHYQRNVKWDTSRYFGNTDIEFVAYDAANNFGITGVTVAVDNSLNIVLNLVPSSVSVGSLFSISGTITDNNGNGTEGVEVCETSGFSTSDCSVTDSDGRYSIEAVAPGVSGSHDVKIQCQNGAEVYNESATLSVTNPKQGHDLIVRDFSVSPYSVSPGGSVSLQAAIDNAGIYSESVDVHWEIYPPNSNSPADEANINYGSLSPSSSLGQKSENLQTTSQEGQWTARVWIELDNDEFPENNALTFPFYVGEPQSFTTYRVYREYCEKGSSKTVSTTRGNIGVNVAEWSTSGAVTYELDSMPTRLNVGEFTYYYGNEVVLFHEGYEPGDLYVQFELWTHPPERSFTISPGRVVATQGDEAIFSISSASSISDDVGFSEHIGDGATVKAWNWNTRSVSGGRELSCIIPETATAKTYTFWVRLNIDSKKHTQKLELQVLPGHDVSVSNLSPSTGQSFNPGQQIQVSAGVTAANGYTEYPNIVLNITGQNAYAYIDSQSTVINGTDTVSFTPVWNTTGLLPGDYTIIVSAIAGNDITHGNNSQTSVVHINSPPSILVNVQTDKPNYLQGDFLHIYANVNYDNSPVTDANVYGQITFPDQSQINLQMSYNSITGRYECSLAVLLVGNYSVTVLASKNSFTDGTASISAIAVTNAPPETEIASSFPSEGQWIRQNTIALSWLGTDTGTPTTELQYAWKIDTQPWSEWTVNSSEPITGLNDGEHTFSVKAYDGQLEDQTPAQRTFSIDTVAPVVDISTDGGNGPGNDFSTTQPRVTLQGSCIDSTPSSGLSSVSVSAGSANDGSFENWGFTVALHEGENLIRISAEDNAGNIGNDTIVITYAASGPGTLQFSDSTYNINEDGVKATITVTRTEGSDGAVSVAYSTTDGTAAAGNDYTATNGPLQWADGDSSPKTFDIPILEDAIAEGDETVNLALTNPTGGALLGTQNTAVLTIIDNDTNTTPPSPNPMTWATEPNAVSSTSISMLASTAIDAENPPVSYFFDFVDSPTGGTGGSDSAWQDSTSYTDTELQPNHRYGYRIKARDSAFTPNETSYSSPTVYKYTLANIPGTASFSGITQTCIRANWVPNANRTGTEYYCENVTKGTNSGWTAETYWDSCELTCETSYTFRVKARNGDGTETEWTNLGSEIAAVCGNHTEVTVDILPDKDATISQSYPDNNYGSPSQGVAGSHVCIGYDSSMFAPGGIGHTKGLLHFDLSSIPPDQEITEAKLTLKFQTGNSGTVTINALGLTDDWGEHTVTWNNAPSTGAEFATVTGDSSSDPEFDITDTVKGWYSDNATNRGILLQRSVPDTDIFMAFGSRELSGREPKLVVTYPAGTPPTPNPMTWATDPAGASSTSISMTATIATSNANPPVSYYFEFVDSSSGGTGGLDSTWQSSTTYSDAGLQPNHRYGYRVKARDSAATPNETAYSSPTVYKYTLANAPGTADFSNVTQTSIRTNWDANGNRSGTEYYCENVTNATNSGWTTNAYWDAVGLSCGESYSYRVKVRNGDGIETGWTNLGSQSTQACPGDPTPPIPNPMTWSSQPNAISSTSIFMVGTTAGDAGSPPVSYYFDFVDSSTGGSGGSDSNWQSSTSYTDTGLQPNHQYGYRVKASDSASTPNETGYSSTVYRYTDANAPVTAGFSNITQTSIRANWVPNGNRAGTEYYCENTTEGTNSGWTANTYWDSTGLECGTSYSFRVKARNGDGLETDPTELGSKTTLPCDGELSVTPSDGLASSGDQGGPFSPTSKTYTLENTGDNSIDWTASKNEAWVTLSSAGSTLTSGASTTVTVSINGNADSLAPGPYNDTVTFTNTTNGKGDTERAVSLNVSDKTVNFSTSTGPVTVPEGQTNTFQVKLSAEPSSTVTATVTRVSGDSDITVQSGATLTFTTTNYDTYQTVTLAAAEDADTTNGEATIRVSASGILDKDVTATEADNNTGLIAHWKMDESGWDGTANEVKDETGNYHGTAQGGATTGSGKYGKGGSFDGVDDYVSFGSDQICSGATSVSMWINPRVSQGNGLIEINVDGKGLLMWDYNEQLTMSFRGEANQYWSLDADIIVGEWNHVVGVYSGGGKSSSDSYTLYIDGELQTNQQLGRVDDSFAMNCIGRDSRNPYFFDGIIDDVRIYERALSSEDVQELYSAEPSHTLSLSGAGSGSVKVDGTLRTPPWSGTFAEGTNVTLETVADNGWDFSAWSGDLTGSTNPTTITMNADKAITANFTETHDNSLVGYWKMDEASWDGTAGEVEDSSGGGHHGTSYGGANTVLGKIGNAGSFDGVDDYVAVPDNDLLDLTEDFSIGFWAKAIDPTSTGAMILVSKLRADTWNEGSWLVFFSNDSIDFFTPWNSGDTRASFNNDGYYSVDEWAHVTITFNDTTNIITCYINGEERGSESFDCRILNTSRDLRIGTQGNNHYPGSWFKGLVDDLFIYNRVLSETEIQALYGDVSHPPEAVDDSYSTDEDTQLIVPVPGVLTNDSDGDGDSLTAVLDNGPGSGTLTLNSDGSFNYTPGLNFNGSDSFTYHANDGGLDSNVATVTITVNAVPDPPVIAEGKAVPAAMDEDGSPTAFDLTLHATDADGDTITWGISRQATHGTAAAAGTGGSKVIDYVPEANWNDVDNFDVQVSDGNGGTDTITVNVTVNPVNDAPGAINDNSYSTDENTQLTIPAPGVLANDSDVDGDLLTAVLDSGPTNGTLVFSEDGSFIYIPNAQFNGEDGFTYHARDGALDSNVANVTIQVIEAITYTISGHVRKEGAGFAGVLMAGLPGDPLTEVDGSYEVVVDQGWSGTVEPQKDGHSFEPHVRTYSKVAEDFGSEDYTSSDIPVIEVGLGNGRKGGDVTIPITLTNVSGVDIAALSVDIEFDNTILENPRAVIGPAGDASGKEVIASLPGTGVFRIAVLSVSNNSPIVSGVVAYATFTIRSDASTGETLLTSSPSASNPLGGVVEADGLDGGVIFSTCDLGDCDCNGTVSIAEVQSGINMFLGILPVEYCVDWNGDDTVSISEIQKTINNFLGIGLENATADSDGEPKGALADGLPTLDLGVIDGSRDERVKIPVTLANVSGNNISAVSMDIAFDSGAVENPSVEIGPAGSAADKTTISSEPSPGTFRIGVLSMSNNDIIGDGIVAYVNFDIMPDAAKGDTVLGNTPSASDPLGNNVPLEGADGMITVDGIVAMPWIYHLLLFRDQ